MSVTASGSEEFPQAERNSGGIPAVIADLMLIAPFNDLGTTETILRSHHGWPGDHRCNELAARYRFRRGTSFLPNGFWPLPQDNGPG